MYRFLLRPKWIGFHLLVVAGIVVMVNLGFWQLRRLDQRRDFNARVEARGELPPEPLDEVLASGSPDDIEWRVVTVTGRYLADEQVVVVNRSQGGRAGDNVVTPIELDDGRILLVNRGFVPLNVAAPPPPDGDVDVTGRLRQSQERRTGQLSDPGEGDLTELQRLDIPRLVAQLPGEVVPVYVDLLTSEPPEAPGLPEPVARPPLGEGPHLSYAIQWFIFSVCVAIGWVLAVRRSIATRRRAVSA
ncbi:MAG TPA: SURF1 family protein [Ilumatobacteraceae bacterium]|nr:SURF1 family protein [Ilumatobacteraceae bacterium]